MKADFFLRVDRWFWDQYMAHLWDNVALWVALHCFYCCCDQEAMKPGEYEVFRIIDEEMCR